MTLQQWLKALSLKDFVSAFGFTRDPASGDIVKFKPWEKQLEFLDWLDNLTDTGILLKSRQAGGSTMSAFFAIKTAFETPNAEILVLSKDEDASKYFLGKRVMDAFENLPQIKGLSWPQITNRNLSLVQFSNGSKIISVPATAIGAAGITAKLVIFDEVALVDLNAAARGGAKEVFATVRPVVQKAGGRILMLSTARPASYFNELCQEILAGERKMPLFFFPASADPTLTPEVFAQLKEEYSPIEFKREYPLTPEDAFLANTGLVFKSFGERHIQEVDYTDAWDTLVVYDHGYRHPAVALVFKFDWRKDVLFVWKELVWKETQAEEVAKQLRILKSKLPETTKWIADAAIFSQTGHRESIADVFTKCGIPFRPSYKHRGLDPFDGSIAHVGFRFTRDKILIHPSCTHLIWELRNWRWKAKGTRDVPEDTGDDAIDCLRYAVAELTQRKEPQEPQALRAYSQEKLNAYKRIAETRERFLGKKIEANWQSV